MISVSHCNWGVSNPVLAGTLRSSAEGLQDVPVVAISQPATSGGRAGRLPKGRTSQERTPVGLTAWGGQSCCHIPLAGRLRNKLPNWMSSSLKGWRKAAIPVTAPPVNPLLPRLVSSSWAGGAPWWLCGLLQVSSNWVQKVWPRLLYWQAHRCRNNT